MNDYYQGVDDAKAEDDETYLTGKDAKIYAIRDSKPQ